jgi:hypothetical protein
MVALTTYLTTYPDGDRFWQEPRRRLRRLLPARRSGHHRVAILLRVARCVGLLLCARGGYLRRCVWPRTPVQCLRGAPATGCGGAKVDRKVGFCGIWPFCRTVAGRTRQRGREQAAARGGGTRLGRPARLRERFPMGVAGGRPCRLRRPGFARARFQPKQRVGRSSPRRRRHRGSRTDSRAAFCVRGGE